MKLENMDILTCTLLLDLVHTCSFLHQCDIYFRFGDRRRVGGKMAHISESKRDQSPTGNRPTKSQRRRSQSDEHPNMCDLRIVLLGKNVSENSRVRNSILGIDVHESDAPIKQHNVLKISGMVKDRHVTVINTLHLLNLNISDHQITQTVRECVFLSDPGPHVFILILQYNNFTEEDLRRVKHVLNKFSGEAIKRAIVLTTDEERDDSYIHQLIKECGERHLEFEKENPEWQSDIFKRVDKILQETQEEYLTCEIFGDAEGTSVDEEKRSYGSEKIKRQQREWEDEKKQQIREREEDERKRKEKHDEQLREKQEELEKIKQVFEREREERQKIDEERQKQKEREEKEREYDEKRHEIERHYEQLERERKREWERRKREDDER
ncbi:GTPase IMAP family member 7-like [Cyprinus carpio]|uniref:GTPase IMAP family member 7-like n=1 Tax=Cyprinus carpio TaxID=7962 RepID=A0A9Q9ZSC2_CYPCA|nr:GTPase IMAP family member 7-like [Cyprinus carpio]